MGVTAERNRDAFGLSYNSNGTGSSSVWGTSGMELGTVHCGLPAKLDK